MKKLFWVFVSSAMLAIVVRPISPFLSFFITASADKSYMHQPPGVESQECESFYLQTVKLITGVQFQWEIDCSKGNFYEMVVLLL